MADPERGRELHREFVGMLFALAIAEVAIQGATLVNGKLSLSECAPSYSHLILATAIITTSWVGWGWSKHSLSNIRHIFTCDYCELLVDLWLVAVYFFIVKSVELPSDGGLEIIPSYYEETRWVVTIFATYFVWDLITKVREDDKQKRMQRSGQRFGWLKRDDNNRLVILQRIWASVICTILSAAVFWTLSMGEPGSRAVIEIDIALFAIIFLFRALKVRNISELKMRDYGRILFFIGIFAVSWFSATGPENVKNLFLAPFSAPVDLIGGNVSH